MKIVEEYNVLRGDTPLELSRNVMTAIRDGFQPHGSMVIEVVNGVYTRFYQPMVRYAEEKE